MNFFLKMFGAWRFTKSLILNLINKNGPYIHLGKHFAPLTVYFYLKRTCFKIVSCNNTLAKNICLCYRVTYTYLNSVAQID